MFIVIEGADGSGKSSLIEAVRDKLHARHAGDLIIDFHKGRPEEETRQWALSEYVISLERLDWTGFVHGVADRWHWGEMTYAPLKRPHTCKDDYGLLGVAGWRWVEMFMASRGMAQFWLYQPLEVITSRLTERGDDFVRVDELGQILDLYFKASQQTQSLAGRVTPHPSKIELLAEVARDIVDIAARRSKAAKVLADFPEYIGPPDPAVLLVGDKRNRPSDTILPFKPIDGNSGEYLLSALPETLWRRVGIINAADVNGTRAHQLHRVLGEPHMIALGRNAEYELRNSGFYTTQYTVMPHPRYVSRFHHHDKYQYGQAIERLTETRGKEPDIWMLP